MNYFVTWFRQVVCRTVIYVTPKTAGTQKLDLFLELKARTLKPIIDKISRQSFIPFINLYMDIILEYWQVTNGIRQNI